MLQESKILENQEKHETLVVIDWDLGAVQSDVYFFQDYLTIEEVQRRPHRAFLHIATEILINLRYFSRRQRVVKYSSSRNMRP